MWPRHRSNKASHNGRTPGTLDWRTARNEGVDDGTWGWVVSREGRDLTALDILPATRGYHQWDSMRDHVLPPRYPEKCCLCHPGYRRFSFCAYAYAVLRRMRRDVCVAVSRDFQVLSSSLVSTSFIIRLPGLVRNVGSHEQSDTRAKLWADGALKSDRARLIKNVVRCSDTIENNGKMLLLNGKYKETDSIELQKLR